MEAFLQPISKFIWQSKYQYQIADQIYDTSIEATWNRVANAIAKAENPKNRNKTSKEFYSILENFQFLPGGRILAGAGCKRKVTLINCFVMGEIEDTLSGIFTSLKEAALTLQQGGGVGFDFSSLRPEGLPTTRSGSIASGPISFMQIWDAMCATMQSTGARRGAMMGTLRIDHPDIEAFIEAKRNPLKLRHFNVSILITDEFLQAVKNNANWALCFPIDEHLQSSKSKKYIIMRRFSGSSKKIPCRVFKKVKARALWQLIIKSAYDYAEPGVIFEDTINRMNNLYYQEWISCTNPCGEIPLPQYGACNLGSINLTQFVESAFTEKAKLNFSKIEQTIEIATRFQDNVIDVTRYPLNKQKQNLHANRRIGIGLTGLADCFVMLGIEYGSAQSVKLAKKIMQTISHTTWASSIELAKTKGSFAQFDKKRYLQGQFVQTLPNELQQQIKKFGIRNSHHNAIAPTGTISILANNVSNSIEPIFNAIYDRRVRTSSGALKTFSAKNYAYLQWQQQTNKEHLPPAWKSVDDLTVDHHLKIQAAIQPFVDNAISKTINIPEDFPFENLKRVYQKAYQMGLKGCTVFRPNPITGSVITSQQVAGEGPPCCSFEERKAANKRK